MKFFYMSLSFLCFLLLSYSLTYASIGPVSLRCSFVGVVKDVSIRKEPGRGISEGETFTYIDVKISIVKDDENDSDSHDRCDFPIGSLQTFQMHKTLMGKNSPSVPKENSCIKGSSQFIGDGNFMSGDWLAVEETLPSEDCAVKSDQNN